MNVEMDIDGLKKNFKVMVQTKSRQPNQFV